MGASYIYGTCIYMSVYRSSIEKYAVKQSSVELYIVILIFGPKVYASILLYSDT